MKKLIVATRNKGKIKEIKELLSDLDYEISSLDDYEDMPPIVEDADTFEGNATIKAKVIGEHTGCLVMGEDSGIAVDALDGRPGVYSARYAGEGCDDEDNNDKLLEELGDTPLEKRTARYWSYIAFYNPEREDIKIAKGSCEGAIAFERHGTNGFGYDPLFIPQGYDNTFGELDPSIKASISHRSKALNQFREILARLLGRSLPG